MLSILTKIKQWFENYGNLVKDLAKAEAYIKSLESGEIITALKAELASLEAKAKADIDKVEAVLTGWRNHAITLEEQLKSKL